MCSSAFQLQWEFSEIIVEEEVCRTFSEGTGKGIPNSASVSQTQLCKGHANLRLKLPLPSGEKKSRIPAWHAALPGSPRSPHTWHWALHTFLSADLYVFFYAYHPPLWLNPTHTSSFRLDGNPSLTLSAPHSRLAALFSCVCHSAEHTVFYFGWQASSLI